MKRILITAIILLLFGFLYSEDNKIRIVVFDLDVNSSDVNKSEAITLSEYLRDEFINAGAFEVVSRKQLNKLMEEYKFQATGLTSESNAVVLGKLLNVKRGVIGTIGKFGDTLLISLKLFDLESGKYITAENIKDKTKEAILDKISQAVKVLTERALSKNEVNTQTTNDSQQKNKEPLKNKEIIQIPADNLFQNGDFNQGKDGWQLWTGEGGVGRFEIDQFSRLNGINSAKIQVLVVGNYDWSVHLRQHFQTKTNKAYILSFMAMADDNIEFFTSLVEDKEPFKPLLVKTVKAGPDPQVFTYTNDYPSWNSGNMMINMCFGKLGKRTIWLDVISLAEK